MPPIGGLHKPVDEALDAALDAASLRGKKGDLSVLANWRPMSLVNTVVKLYNRLLLNRLTVGCEPYLRLNLR